MGHKFIDLHIRNRDVYGAKGNREFMNYVTATLFPLRAVFYASQMHITFIFGKPNENGKSPFDENICIVCINTG